jgi:hypothetical protein
MFHNFLYKAIISGYKYQHLLNPIKTIHKDVYTIDSDLI